MRIAMIGTGYVGLVSGACFADFGHHVVCVDKDQGKIDRLLQGIMPIWEPGLDQLVDQNVRGGRLSFTTTLADAVDGADAVFIAVGTPSRRGDGHADLSYVEGAVRELASVLKAPTVVVTKSTVPVGTGDWIAKLLDEAGAPAGCSVASNPEFLREGAAIRDFKFPDRVLVGAEDARAQQVLTEIYRPLFINKSPVVIVGRRTAELAKYAANAFLAMKISFINEMANLCEATGADVQDVARAIGLDNRIGSKFLHAGPGYGGSCFPKDTLALLRTAEEHGVEQKIISTVVAVNDARKDEMADRVIAAMGGAVAGKTIGLLGLTFKPNTDDMRDAPSIPLVRRLVEAGAKVVAHDPVGREQAEPLLPAITYAETPEAVADGADALVLVTEWDLFRGLDLKALASRMNAHVLVDLRNVYRPEDASEAGFTYHGIGRGGHRQVAG